MAEPIKLTQIDEKNYLDLDGLKHYDELIKAYINRKSTDLDGALADEIARATAAEEKALADAKAYTDEQIGDLDEGVLTVAAAILAEKTRAEGAEGDLQDAIDAEEAARKAQIGELGKVSDEEGAADHTVKSYVDAAVEAINGDAEALEGRVEALEATHATKEDGSFKTVAEEVNEAVTDLIDGAPAALDTLKEIADWIANQDESGVTDAATLVARVEENAQAIADEQERAEDAEKALSDRLDVLEAINFVAITNAEIDALFATPVDQEEEEVEEEPVD